MPIALYMDENVSKAVTKELRRQGIDVIRLPECWILDIGVCNPDAKSLFRQVCYYARRSAD